MPATLLLTEPRCPQKLGWALCWLMHLCKAYWCGRKSMEYILEHIHSFYQCSIDGFSTPPYADIMDSLGLLIVLWIFFAIRIFFLSSRCVSFSYTKPILSHFHPKWEWLLQVVNAIIIRVGEDHLWVPKMLAQLRG